METLRNDSMRASESMLSHINHIEELTKEKEEELLYGCGEDGDEEDALSDDSMRLRLSDDEDLEAEDAVIVLSAEGGQREQKDLDAAEPISTTTASEQSSSTEEKDAAEKKKSGGEVKEEKNNADDCVESTITGSKEKTDDKSEEKETAKQSAAAGRMRGESPARNDDQSKQPGKSLRNSSCHKTEDCKNQLVNSNQQCNNAMNNFACHEIVEVNADKEGAEVERKIVKVEEKLDRKEEAAEIEESNDSFRNDNQDVEPNEPRIPKTNNITSDNREDCKKSLRQDTTSVSTHDLELICIKSNTVERPSSKPAESTIGDSTTSVNKAISSNDPCVSAQENGKNEIPTGTKTENDNLTVLNSRNKSAQECEKPTITLEEDNVSDEKTKDVVKQENNVKKDFVPANKNSTMLNNNSLIVDATNNSDSSEKKSSETSVGAQRRRKRRKRMGSTSHEVAIEEDKQVKDGGRQKRKTARNAEEIIRKKFLNHDSDLESSDGSEKFVIINHKMSQGMRPLSPPSLKRNVLDVDTVTINGTAKKIKTMSEVTVGEVTIKESKERNMKHLNFVHKFFQRDLKEKLPKLKQEELEELLIQKIVETITMHSEIGKLREQARISEKNQEAMRARCQQLAKQIKDFEMVLSRNAADRRANNDKPTPPIKINRSVGLQVNFMTEHGMQNLRQLQQNNVKSNSMSNSNAQTIETNNNAVSPRRGIKIRSPRRSDVQMNLSGGTGPQNHVQNTPLLPNITPAALVVAKPVEPAHPSGLSNQTANLQQILPNTQQLQPQQQQQQHQQQQQQQQQTPQAIVLNGKLPNQVNRHGTSLTINKSKPSDLIDLTDEEEKSKAAVNVPTVTTQVVDSPLNVPPKTQQCFQRVIQAIPGNVTIASQPTSIRVVQPASQPTPTALVNNMNAPRLAYVMQSGVGSARQLLITSNSNQIRPVTSCNRASFSTLTYKTGTSIANGTVRVLTTPATANVQLNKHPAPLPDTPGYVMNPVWKLPPPAPSLKISKVANGIVLSWNMNLSDRYADIASYQLYAYQEIAGAPPSTGLWKKVGDVRALPLPMACTLTQFSEGNNYYFAVRAVDTHSRKGPYSIPGNISL